MSRLASWLVVLGAVVLTGSPRANAAPPQQLPPPQPAQPQKPAVTLPPPVHFSYSYQRVSRYEVWQNVGVDRYGRFRPVVIYSPYASYYRATHEPYPYVSTYSWEFTPYIMGPAQPLLRR
jgi:hypothetical protein